LSRITDLPKVELHVHIEGTLEPELIVELAHRNGIVLPDPDLESLRARYRFADLQSFLDLYYENMAVLRTADDFAAMALAYATRAGRGGVVHAEVFFDPQAHLARGVGLAAIVGGLTDGFARATSELGFTADLIACFLRDRPEAEALAVLEDLIESDAPIIGVGLDSAEVGNPASRFRDVFARAAEAGLHRVAHAGEEGGAGSIVEALDALGVERIDHGVQAVEDEAVLRRVVEERIPLTVCPLSNLALKGVRTLTVHPLARLLHAGVVATINSDDPAYFGGYAEDNYEAVVQALGLDEAAVALLARNAVTASFLGAERKADLLAAVDTWAEALPEG
jgi:adenosine deaminase